MAKSSENSKESLSLPPISDLFHDSWELFRTSVMKISLLTVFSFAVFFVVSIIGLIVISVLVFATGVYKFFSPAQFGALLSSAPILFLLIVLVLLVFVGFFIIFSSLMQIATILVVGKSEETFQLGTILRKSWAVLGAYLIASFVVGIITFGGFMFFLFPFFLFYFYFLFTSYEVVLNGQKAYAAIRRSSVIVRSHFGQILGRVLVLMFVYIFVIYGAPMVLEKTAPGMKTIFGIISFFVNTLLGWFSLCYSLTLYKQASKDVPMEKEASMRWIWVVAILGWIIGAFWLLLGAGVLATAISQKAWDMGQKQNNFRQFQQDNSTLPQYQPGSGTL